MPPSKKKPSVSSSEKNTGSPSSTSISSNFKDVLKTSLMSFEKISEKERIDSYGDTKFLDQFWMYFKEKNPALLSIITKEKLPEYLTSLDASGFKLNQLLDQPESFHYEFQDKDPEPEVMRSTLTYFRDFCKDPHNALPSSAFADFATEVGFDSTTCSISRTGSLKRIEDIHDLWKKFIDKKGITLTDNQKKNIENVLCPEYDPVERIMVEVALEKILPLLSGALRTDFLATFSLPLTAFSYYGDVRLFTQRWRSFLEKNSSLISPALQKKLSSIIVTNGDIRKKLEAAGKKLNSGDVYSTQEKYFVRVFSKIVTRQLFEEAKKSTEMVDHYFTLCGESIKSFPPYANHIYKLYPYNDAEISKVSPDLHAQLQGIDTDISQIESKIASATTKEEKSSLATHLKTLRQQREDIKWKAYLEYLASKDADLGRGMSQLYAVNFDFSRMSPTDQQSLLTLLVEHSLHDFVKNKAPALLDVAAEGLKQFVHDLFDLQKKDITLPTSQGPVHLHFAHKKFLSEKVPSFLSVGELSSLENLPLSFSLDPTPSSQDFFEKGALRGNQGVQLFDTFKGKNQECVLGENYKVKLTKDGKEVEGYLSQYPPSDELPDDGTMRYLYSQPVNVVSDDRTLLTRSDSTPVTISQEEESLYDIEVLNKKIDLTGQAISSLIFAYVIGQQPVAQQSLLEKKMKKMDAYVQKTVSQEVPSATIAPPSLDHSVEDGERQKILESWKALAGNTFEHDKEYGGLVVGTRLFLKAGESVLPPDNKSSDWMHLEITKIDRKKKNFVVKFHGGERPLSMEGTTKELPLSCDIFSSLEEILGDKIYKIPAPDKNYDTQLTILKKSNIASGFDYSFDTLKWTGKSYQFALGEYLGQDVNYFGREVHEYIYDKKAGRTVSITKHIAYKIRYTSQGTIIVSTDASMIDENDAALPKYEDREMDINMFILFITSKQLQPKADIQLQKGHALSAKEKDPDLGYKKPKPRFSLNNIGSFFKNSLAKVKDGIKKYDEEKAEDLTDLALQNGDLFTKFGKSRGKVFNRVGSGFEQAGIEYYTTRDARIWKKIEKWQKYYEQEKHYPSFFYTALNDMITGKEKPHDMYKIPAMLLTVINKEKSPYARHFDLMGKGHWVNLILGKQHQSRYLEIMNKKIADLKENSQLNGSDWTVKKNEEIVKLEMKYIVAVIDGREHTAGDAHEKQQAAKWSRVFAEKLDEAIDTKFGFKGIDEKNKSIPSTTTFEFAEYEYTRHLKNNKAAASLPYFKYMAQSAQTSQQWQLFQMHVLSSVMSGWFLHCVDGSTQGWIKDICRSRGFLPGLWAKDINQQTKVLQLLNTFTQGSFQDNFTYSIKKGDTTIVKKFDINNFSLGNLSDTPALVSDGFKKWWDQDKNGQKLCDFLSFKGKDIGGNKKLVELAYDKDVPDMQKTILQEYIAFGEESNQDLDSEVKHNYGSFLDLNLTKCATLVGETMKYDNHEFDGKDSHEKAGPIMFWADIAHSIPQHKESSASSVIFFVKKFLSWFDGCGFAKGNQRTLFLKRLRTIQTMYKNPALHKQAEDMLWYTINGVIIEGNRTGKGTPPDEFMAGIDAFKGFFKSNLDVVLSDEVVGPTMGEYYTKEDEAKTSYSLGDWTEYTTIVATRGLSLFGSDKNKNAEIQKKYKKDDYKIYEDLYGIAESLQRSHYIENVFTKYNSSQETPVTPQAKGQSRSLNTGVTIQNTETLAALDKNLTSSPKKRQTSSDDSDDDFIAANEDLFSRAA